MEDVLVPIVVIPVIFIGLPWIILHYVTKWRQAPKFTREDENVLDEMYNLARRLEDRMQTVERLVAADNPDFKPGLNSPAGDWPRDLSSPHGNFQLDRRN